MSYDEGMVDAPYDTSESDAEQAAHHQLQLDVLWFMGNQYNMRLDHMRELCETFGVSFAEICKHTGKKS